MFRVILWGIGQRYEHLKHVFQEEPLRSEVEIIGVIGASRGGRSLSCVGQGTTFPL